MSDKCFLKFCYNCSDKDALSVSQSGGDRLQNVIEASEVHGDNVHVELKTKLRSDSDYQIKYHKACMTKYLTKAKRLSSKLRSAASPSVVPEKRTRSSLGHPFDWLYHCLYCGESCLLKRKFQWTILFTKSWQICGRFTYPAHYEKSKTNIVSRYIMWKVYILNQYHFVCVVKLMSISTTSEPSFSRIFNHFWEITA